MKLLKLFDRTFWLYVGLGFFNYFFCSAVMLIFRNVLEVPETACLIIAFAMQTTISFFLNRYVTFRGIRISKYWPLFFVCSIAVCYVVAKVLLRDVFAQLVELPWAVDITEWLRNLLHVSREPALFRENLVMLACTFTYCVINYLGQRYFVFRAVKEPEQA